MAKKPPVHELDFLKLASNFRELTGKLERLGISLPDVHAYANHVCECWFRLGEEHLDDAKRALVAGSDRAVYSRAYYAAYNASKAARYFTAGFVSLKGDDHSKASAGLPDDFPDVANWSQNVALLYEHRLRADYDNWGDTRANHTILPKDAINLAEQFVLAVRSYMNAKHGVVL